MFGPNQKPSFSHREQKFETLYAETEDTFRSFAGLSKDEWDVFFVTGSGTCALETVLYSFSRRLKVVTSGHFSTRIAEYLQQNDKLADTSEGHVVAVQFETASCQHNDITSRNDTVIIADCVSSFPYYKPVGNIWVSVSSKQLGCQPGLSIIVMRKDLWGNDYIKPADASYMSLAKYKVKSEQSQTPHTPAIGLLSELNVTLSHFDVGHHRQIIDERRKKIETLVNPKSRLTMGEGPVITLKNGNEKVQKLVDQFGLYNNSSEGPQIFLWTGTDHQYEQLYEFAEKEF